jgi:glyoxylate utilization-related uncharacterized protein
MTLVVKLEIHPGGDSSRAREIGRVEIANMSNLSAKSDYRYEFVNTETGWPGTVGVVEGHYREHGAWMLLAKVLRSAFRLDRRMFTKRDNQAGEIQRPEQ